MDFAYGEPFTESSPEAYERLILDVLLGDATLFPHHEEVEESWRIIDPLEEHWAGTTPEPYAPAPGVRPAATDARARRPRLAAGMTTSRLDGRPPPSQVAKALAAERRAAGAVDLRPGADLRRRGRRAHVEETVAAARAASTAHPCRVLTVVRRRPGRRAPRLDAEVSVGGDSGPGEAVVLRLSGELIEHADAVVLPLLAPDTPVVTWWAGPPPAYPAGEPLGILASRRITDTYLAADPRDVAASPGASNTSRATPTSPGPGTPCGARSSRAVVDAVARPGHRRDRGHRARQPLRRADRLAGWARRLDIAGRAWSTARARPSPRSCLTVDDASAGTREVRLTRPDGSSAILAQPGQPRPPAAAARSATCGELLAEELRRLDADEPYADALAAVRPSCPRARPTGRRAS